MPGKRCQVCDGPVVNGRCKLCGMPYRNDEVLYHLNENRRDHYRHATDKAREIMRSQQNPFGGGSAASSARKGQAGSVKKETGGRAASTENKSLASRRKELEKKRARSAAGSAGQAAFGRTAGNTAQRAGRTAGNMAQQAGRTAGDTAQRAGRSATDTVQANRARTEKNGSSSWKQYSSVVEKKSGKGKLTGALAVFVFVLTLVSVIPGVVRMVQSIVMEKVLTETNTYWPETNDPSQKFENMVNGTDYDYALGCDYGYVWVGSEIDPGTYRVFVTEGRAMFTVEDLDGKIWEYQAAAGDSYSYAQNVDGEDAYVTLLDGDAVCVTEAEEGAEQIFLQRVEAL